VLQAQKRARVLISSVVRREHSTFLYNSGPRNKTYRRSARYAIYCAIQVHIIYTQIITHGTVTFLYLRKLSESILFVLKERGWMCRIEGGMCGKEWGCVQKHGECVKNTANKFHITFPKLRTRYIQLLVKKNTP